MVSSSYLFGRLRLAAVLGVVLVAAMIAVLAVTATNAFAQENISCTRTGDTVEWTPTDRRVQLRGSSTASNLNSVWLTTVDDSDVTSYDITNADAAKAPGDRYFVRYRVSGQVFNVECTAGAPTPPTDGLVCTQEGSALSWSQLDVSRNLFNVRSVNPDGTTSWVASVQGTNANTLEVNPDVAHVIRYRITFSPGDTQTFDVTCSGGDTQPPVPPVGAVECSLIENSFGQNISFEVVIENTVIGDSWSLIDSGSPTGQTATEPRPAIETFDNTENVYFSVNKFRGAPERVIEVAPTNDLGATILCGSFGQNPVPVTACRANEGFDGSDVELILSPSDSFFQTFDVRVDGVVVADDDVIRNDLDFRGSFFDPPVSYTVRDVSLTSSFIIDNQDGSVITCTGDGVGIGPVATACVVEQNTDQFSDGVNLILAPQNTFLADFDVRVDGVVVNEDRILEIGDGGINDFERPAIAYNVRSSFLSSSFEIVNRDGSVVDCTGDEVDADPAANFCNQSAGRLIWQSVDGALSDAYHVRQINADGGSTWVTTTFGDETWADVGEGVFLIRYRIIDGAGNNIVVNNTCVPN